MESNKLGVVVVVLLVVAMAAVLGPATAAGILGDGGLCNMTQKELQVCKPSISMENPVATPDPGCCAALKHADLSCLCSYKDSPLLSFYGIDSAKAAALPGQCGIAPPSNC